MTYTRIGLSVWSTGSELELELRPTRTLAVHNAVDDL